MPTNLEVGENAPDTEFQLSGPADVAEFKLKATAGVDLFVGIGTFQELDLKLFDPNGKLLKSFFAAGGIDTPVEEGVELHPTVSGTYTVRVAGDPNGAVNYPTDGAVWAYPDCRGGPATKCTIAPGNTKRASLAGSNDDDAYAIKAPAGRRYTATLQVANRDNTLYFTDLNLVDGKGGVVASQLTGAGAARRNKATLNFVLPSTGGPFYLQVHPRPASSFNLRGSFTLSLQQQ